MTMAPRLTTTLMFPNLFPPQNTLYLWTTPHFSQLSPQNTPFLWTTRVKNIFRAQKHHQTCPNWDENTNREQNSTLVCPSWEALPWQASTIYLQSRTAYAFTFFSVAHIYSCNRFFYVLAFIVGWALFLSVSEWLQVGFCFCAFLINVWLGKFSVGEFQNFSWFIFIHLFLICFG